MSNKLLLRAQITQKIRGLLHFRAKNTEFKKLLHKMVILIVRVIFSLNSHRDIMTLKKIKKIKLQKLLDNTLLHVTLFKE